MIDNQLESKKKYAAYLARKFFSGQISKREIIEQFPKHDKDFKMTLLYDRIMKKPRQSWFFGVSKSKYEKFIVETYEIIEDLEAEKYRFKIMKRLFEELWLQSDNCSEPIEHIGFALIEVAKSTGNSRDEIRRYFDLLIEKNFIQIISKKPFQYKFTKSGKQVKTDLDIDKIIRV